MTTPNDAPQNVEEMQNLGKNLRQFEENEKNDILFMEEAEMWASSQNHDMPDGPGSPISEKEMRKDCQAGNQNNGTEEAARILGRLLLRIIGEKSQDNWPHETERELITRMTDEEKSAYKAARPAELPLGPPLFPQGEGEL